MSIPKPAAAIKETNCADFFDVMFSEDDFPAGDFPAVTGDIKTITHTYNVDPLALVLFWKETDQVPAETFGPVQNYDIAAALQKKVYEDKYEDLFHPPAQYVAQAAEIRQYYLNKFSMISLMGNQLSEFQKEFSAFLTSEDIKILDWNHISILVSMPRFYAEDTKIDNLVETLNSCNPTEMDMRTYEVGPCSLQFVSKDARSTKARQPKVYDYWFKDSDNHLYRLAVDLYTSEAHLLDTILRMKNDKLDIIATTTYQKLFGRDFVYKKIANKGYEII